MNLRERKKEKTKNSIAQCALTLFNEKGFNETSMDEIAERSDVSKGTLYNYFQDKESILAEYVHTVIGKSGEEIIQKFNQNANVKEQLGEIVDFMNNIINTDLELAEIYFKYRCRTFFSNNAFNNPERSGLENIILEVIKHAQEKNELRKDISPVKMARNFMLLYINFFISAIYEEGNCNIAKLKDVLIELFLNGVRI